jgi:hypothetical protein
MVSMNTDAILLSRGYTETLVKCAIWLRMLAATCPTWKLRLPAPPLVQCHPFMLNLLDIVDFGRFCDTRVYGGA